MIDKKPADAAVLCADDFFICTRYLRKGLVLERRCGYRGKLAGGGIVPVAVEPVRV